MDDLNVRHMRFPSLHILDAEALSWTYWLLRLWLRTDLGSQVWSRFVGRLRQQDRSDSSDTAAVPYFRIPRCRLFGVGWSQWMFFKISKFWVCR